MRTNALYREMIGLVMAIENCAVAGNAKWQERHTARLEKLAADYLPSGSGFDNGTSVWLAKSSGKRGGKLVLTTSFHHMDGHGSYDGWTEHTVTITPDLFSGFDIAISGRDRNGIKDYIGDTFDLCLRAEVAIGEPSDVAAENVDALNAIAPMAWPGL